MNMPSQPLLWHIHHLPNCKPQLDSAERCIRHLLASACL